VQQQEPNKQYTDDELRNIGRQLLKSRKAVLDTLDIYVENVECSKRKVLLVKVAQAYHLFEELIVHYGINQVMEYIDDNNLSSLSELQKSLAGIPARTEWLNIGGQLLPQTAVHDLKDQVKNGKISSWDELHSLYTTSGIAYQRLKQEHALASLLEVKELDAKNVSSQALDSLLNVSLSVKEWMAKGIYEARAKDYQNKFRKLVYDTNEEMNKVLGKLEDNSFIKQTHSELKTYREKIAALKQKFSK
jgi:hypothetical protein